MSSQDAVKKAGLKATLPRMLILEVLAKTIDSEVHFRFANDKRPFSLK